MNAKHSLIVLTVAMVLSGCVASSHPAAVGYSSYSYYPGGGSSIAYTERYGPSYYSCCTYDFGFSTGFDMGSHFSLGFGYHEGSSLYYPWYASTYYLPWYGPRYGYYSSVTNRIVNNNQTVIIHQQPESPPRQIQIRNAREQRAVDREERGKVRAGRVASRQQRFQEDYEQPVSDVETVIIPAWRSRDHVSDTDKTSVRMRGGDGVSTGWHRRSARGEPARTVDHRHRKHLSQQEAGVRHERTRAGPPQRQARHGPAPSHEERRVVKGRGGHDKESERGRRNRGE